MKVSIFSITCNCEFPLDIVNRQFKKYMQEEFEFILFNDGEGQAEKDIDCVCSSNGIKTVRVPQNIHHNHNPSECYAQTLNWIIHEHAPKNDYEIVVLMHSDVFPIFNVSITDIIGNSIAASTVEFRLIGDEAINYFYPAFTIINMKLLTNPKELDFSLCSGLDTGGKTKDFIKNNINSVKFIPNHQTPYFIATLEGQENPNPIVEYFKTNLEICKKYGLNAGWLASGFFHYIAGTKWNANENPAFAQGHKERMQLFLKYFY